MSSIAHLAARVHAIEPFRVMEVVKAADALRQAGVDVISMSVGEPDFTAAPRVAAAAVAAIETGATQYTDALGLATLRAAIAGHYLRTCGLTIAPNRIVVTAGASAGLLLACAALVGEGDEVLMPDPCYPCNRHFVTAFGGKPVLVEAHARERYQLTAEHIAAHWNAHSRGVIVASPSNPTGTSMTPAQLTAMLAAVRARGGFAVVDELYQGLYYDGEPTSALQVDPDVITVNSFSKYFNMTGWRLGWLVAPEAHVRDLEKLAQNLYISPPTVSQRAALACFLPETLAIVEARRAEFQARRDFLVPALRELGFGIPVMPSGGFFVYADCSRFGMDSERFCAAALAATGVAFTPGIDFGRHRAEAHVRFAYTIAQDKLRDGVARLAAWLPTLG